MKNFRLRMLQLFFPKYYRLLGAIEVLCRVHTRPDEDIGFKIIMGATPAGYEIMWYTPAWETMLEAIGKYE